MYGPKSGALLVHTRGLHITKLDVGPKLDPHTFHRVIWKPDVCTVTQDQLIHLECDMPIESRKIDNSLDLIAYKNHLMEILEANLDHDDTSSLWFQRPTSSPYLKYGFASVDAKSLVAVEMEYKYRRKTAFFLPDTSQKALGVESQSTSDLVLIKTPNRDAEMLENSCID